MTTNRSSHKPARYTFRQGFRSMTAASSAVLFGITSFFIPFFTLAHLFTKSATYDENWNVTGYVANKDSYHYLIFNEASEQATPVFLMMIAACGIIAAICTFNFITSKKMVNIYYSLGITRTKLFCSKYFFRTYYDYAFRVRPFTYNAYRQSCNRGIHICAVQSI